MEEENKEVVEVPLSNVEVLRVLEAKRQTGELVEYLSSVKLEYKYPLEILREIKDLDASLFTLALLSNTNDISIVSLSDRKKINKVLNY